MPVNQTLADASDLSFKSAFVVYAVALLLFIAYYVRCKALLEARAEASADDHIRSDKVDRLGSMSEMVLYLGIAIHLAAVVLRGLSASRFPWGNLYEYVAVFTLVAMIIAAGVLRRNELRVFWPFLLTPVVGLMFYGGTELYAESAPVVPALKSFWFPIHVSTVVVGASIFLLSGVASVLYLLRMNQPLGKESGWLGALARPLPSARTLDTIAYRTAIWAFPIFGLGVIFGAIWAEAAWGRFWGWDPKETTSFITWILYAGYLHARATSGWRNHLAAWINVVAFATMVFNLFFINMVVSGLHSYAGLN
ncbi:c-type cytochrome biogenesis protein CcsB [Corynebacterium sp. TAE3-ERU12]|uniref:c-type cytochrome biogenesis protein CcsB n=1 Tax=Corynebacterium sp. TAE3-ERU12 TaxID=2849491 RepID=UPI001C46D666|nr:c-type cytochrome biogenesis protein CcsB [Corynebacterium sp. TAE3-ERU12]MBV7294555.1 c-type cytochrome biogenesis protein CcsB [Corynebacterium sp. TAE3-ERU12]